MLHSSIGASLIQPCCVKSRTVELVKVDESVLPAPHLVFLQSAKLYNREGQGVGSKC